MLLMVSGGPLLPIGMNQLVCFDNGNLKVSRQTSIFGTSENIGGK
jgi:hypothetical protein